MCKDNGLHMHSEIEVYITFCKMALVPDMPHAVGQSP